MFKTVELTHYILRVLFSHLIYNKRQWKKLKITEGGMCEGTGGRNISADRKEVSDAIRE